MSVSGGGLSAGSGGGNVDLDAILHGGPQFEARLQTFREHAQQAEDAKQLRKEAAALNEAAAQKLAEANKLIADNKAAAERLAIAQREAEEAKVAFDAKLQKIADIGSGLHDG